MMQGHPDDKMVTLMLLEADLTCIALTTACLLPQFASGASRKAERAFEALARRKRVGVAVVGLSLLLLRLALLPLYPPPLPSSPDDFSFLLAAARPPSCVVFTRRMKRSTSRDVWLVQPDLTQGKLAPYPSKWDLSAGQ